MTDSRKVIRVFLASPGDLTTERRIAKQVIDEFNKLWADALGYHVELIGWEDTVSQYGRPQATINRDLQRCELVLGMMWKRWGTPPSKSGPYSSGFEEEFETSLASRRSSARPELALFFKQIDDELLRDPGPELQRVLNFRQKIIDEKEVYFENFNSNSEFEAKIRSCVTSYIQKIREADKAPPSDDAQATPVEAKPSSRATTAKDTERPFSSEGIAFLKQFLDATESDQSDSYSSIEVARFRLLASTLHTPANDEENIGTHDANLLYINREAIKFGPEERASLVGCGITHYPSETVPLWHWYSSVNGHQRRLLAYHSIFESSRRQIGALTAMRAIEEPLPVSKDLSRELFLASWLSKDADSTQKNAALQYLADCGVPEDLPRIKQEFDLDNYQTRRYASDAIIRISLRQGRKAAIEALYELQPQSISEELTNKVFGKIETIGAEILLQGLSHRSELVRQAAFNSLTKRSQLDAQQTELLLTDTDAEIRLSALLALINQGQVFTDEQAKSILVRPSQTGLYALEGSNSGTSAWEQFQQQQLQSKSDTELETIISGTPIFDRDALLTLCERYFSSKKATLEELLRDRFQKSFEESLSAIEKRYGAESSLLTQTANLKTHLTRQFCRKALDILCKKGGLKELPVGRELLESDFVGYSDLDVDYLRRHGEWQDISLIIAAVGRSDYNTLRMLRNGLKYQIAADAIYAMGKDRIEELFEFSMPDQLLVRLLATISDRSFRKLGDTKLLHLLHSESDTVRKICSLRVIKALTRKRTKSVLTLYVSSSEHRYYNVIHWLDLALSSPREISSAAAAKAIREI